MLEAAPDAEALRRLWVRGGFPGFLAASDGDSLTFRQNFIRTYLERDVPQLGPRIPAENAGTALDHARSRSGRAAQRIQTRLRPFDQRPDRNELHRLSNVRKRLVKSPKVYVRDGGLAHALLGIGDYNAVAGHPVVGASWEGFVIENLLAAAPRRTTASFYRTSAGAEIDLLLELPGNRGLWAIEIKRGLSAAPRKGFHSARKDLNPKRSFLVYSGEERYPISKDVEATGVRQMASLPAER